MTGDGWDPDPADTREDEPEEDYGHARRNAEQLRMARDVFDVEDDDE